MKFRPAVIVAALALAAFPVGGCTGIVNQGIFIEKPQLTVGDETLVKVEAFTTRPGATLTFKPFAQRGRILQIKETDNTFKYFAPYTSRYPDAGGTPKNGDVIQVYVTDGFQTLDVQQVVSLSGTSLIYKAEAAGCSSESSSDCNGPLYVATADDSGLSVRDQKPLKDSQRREIWGSQPSISPDGRRICWVVWPGTDKSPLPKPTGSTMLYTMDAKGDVSVLTGGSPNSGFNVDPSWSPFGNEVVFASDRADGSNYDIYSVSTEQQNLPVKRLTSNAVDERYPAWNPNPQQKTTVAVAVHANSRNDVGKRATSAAWNVMLLDANSGSYTKQITALSQVGTNGPDFAFEPRWRSDGQWLAYTYRGPIGGTASQQTRFQRIFYQDVGTSQGSGQQLNFTDFGGASQAEANPNWSPNGQEIAYLRFTVDDKGNPASTPEMWKGTPNLSKPGTGGSGPGSVGPQRWSLQAGIPAFHLLSTSASPVGGWGVDWR
jgi:Tol biopolymer transport system component